MFDNGSLTVVLAFFSLDEGMERRSLLGWIELNPPAIEGDALDLI
jgi:hypothetical protein